MDGYVALASFTRSGNTWMRHLLFHLFGWKSWCIHSQEDDEVHKAALIPEITEIKAPLVKTHLCEAGGYQHAIHLIRHPYDAIASYWDYCQKWNVPTGPRAGWIAEQAKGWARHAEFWHPGRVAGVYLAIRYRDLLADTASVLEHIAYEFNEVAESNYVEDAIRTCRFRLMQKRSGSDWFFRRGRINEGRTELTEAERLRVLSICGPMMQRFDFES